jgi:hypothetical protein
LKRTDGSQEIHWRPNMKTQISFLFFLNYFFQRCSFVCDVPWPWLDVYMWSMYVFPQSMSFVWLIKEKKEFSRKGETPRLSINNQFNYQITNQGSIFPLQDIVGLRCWYGESRMWRKESGQLSGSSFFLVRFWLRVILLTLILIVSVWRTEPSGLHFMCVDQRQPRTPGSSSWNGLRRWGWVGTSAGRGQQG